MERLVCLVSSKEGQCVLLAGHTSYPHTTTKGFQWEDKTTVPIKRGRGRPRKVVA